MTKQENIDNLLSSIDRLENGKNTVYFLVYDTKNNPRASVKYIYDLAKTLKDNEYNVKLLTEDKTYGGVNSWLGDVYDDIETLSIKEDNVEINVDDILVVPEYYSNVLEQLINVRCVKVMLIQQTEFLFETLPIGSRWSDFDFNIVITTTNESKKYIMELFPESLVYVIPPIIGDNFTPTEELKKPYIAISCKDRSIHRKIISEFYLKYTNLRWITFRDMVQLTYTEFSDVLKECIVGVWVDEDSTFGTFPLECMKSNVPVVGKIPRTEPDWLGDNGIWTYDSKKVVELLATYVMAWIEGSELSDEVLVKINETLAPYETQNTKNHILSIFQTLRNKRIDSLNSAIEKLNEKVETE